MQPARLGRAAAAIVLVLAARAGAQPARRAEIIQAEDRRAPTARDLAVIRAGLRSHDRDTARVAVGALGRLERPSLVGDIATALKSSFPEVRAEAANAVGQAVQPLKGQGGRSVAQVDDAAAFLIGRLGVERDADVRAALLETIGRLPVLDGDRGRACRACARRRAWGRGRHDR